MLSFLAVMHSTWKSCIILSLKLLNISYNTCLIPPFVFAHNSLAFVYTAISPTSALLSIHVLAVVVVGLICCEVSLDVTYFLLSGYSLDLLFTLLLICLFLKKNLHSVGRFLASCSTTTCLLCFNLNVIFTGLPLLFCLFILVLLISLKSETVSAVFIACNNSFLVISSLT